MKIFKNKSALVASVIIVMACGLIHLGTSCLFIWQFAKIDTDFKPLMKIQYIVESIRSIRTFCIFLLLSTVLFMIPTVVAVPLAYCQHLTWFNYWPMMASVLAIYVTVLGCVFKFLRQLLPSIEKYQGFVMFLMMQCYSIHLHPDHMIVVPRSDTWLGGNQSGVAISGMQMTNFVKFTTKAVDDIQRVYKCCGYKSHFNWVYTDWFTHQTIRNETTVPASCCESDGCGTITRSTLNGFIKVYVASTNLEDLTSTMDRKDFDKVEACVGITNESFAECYSNVPLESSSHQLSSKFQEWKEYLDVLSKQHRDNSRADDARMIGVSAAIVSALPNRTASKIHKKSCESKFANWISSYLVGTGCCMICHGFMFSISSICGLIIKKNKKADFSKLFEELFQPGSETETESLTSAASAVSTIKTKSNEKVDKTQKSSMKSARPLGLINPPTLKKT